MAKECVLPACILASSVVPEAILLMRSAHRPCNFNVLLVPGVVYSWGSAMSDRLSALDCRYLTCFCVGDTMVGETNTQIVEYLSWCTKVMMSGRFPAKDFSNNAWPENSWRASMAGEPIAGPYTAFFSGVTHDNKARYQTHKFENFYNTKYVCEQCPACSHLHPLSYGDSRPGANWRRYIREQSWRLALCIHFVPCTLLVLQECGQVANYLCCGAARIPFVRDWRNGEPARLPIELRKDS